VATAAPTAAAPTATAASSGNSAQIAAGKSAFIASSCGACHTLSAAGTSGSAGPNLNGIGSKRTADWIVAQIKNPCAPGHANAAAGYHCASMPPGLASGTTAEDIAAFLAAQK
jgi:mono/diheme cytochrome c family protein